MNSSDAHEPAKNDVYWYREGHPSRPSLQGDLSVDVVVVGGGIAGLSCAQSLRKDGLSVSIVERDFCGGGASGKAAGFILSDAEAELGALRNRLGDERARKIWNFSIQGIERIRRNIAEHQFSCDFLEQDAVFAAIDGKDDEKIEEEQKIYQELKFKSRIYSPQETPSIIGSERFGAAIRCPGSFSMNPFAYCQSLANTLVEAGVHIFENTPVTHIRADGVDTPHGKVNAKHVVVCTDRFLPELGVLKEEVYHIQTFLGITKPLTEEEIHRIFPNGPVMVWDTNLIYTYFRMTPDNRILIGGGDLLHTYDRTAYTHTEHFEHKLGQYLTETFPGISFSFETVWPGLIGISKDLLPVMGPDTEHPSIWYAGAATGLAWATALGLYAAERITTGRNDYDEEFAWNRPYELGALEKFLPTPATFALCNTLIELGE